MSTTHVWGLADLDLKQAWPGYLDQTVFWHERHTVWKQLLANTFYCTLYLCWNDVIKISYNINSTTMMLILTMNIRIILENSMSTFWIEHNENKSMNNLDGYTII